MAMNDTPEVKPTVHLDTAVFGATVQLPAFDKVEAETWFADTNFTLRRFSDSTTKYYYVLSKLDTCTLRKLSTFIRWPRGDDPYKENKEVLCKAYEPPLEQKMDIGDKRRREFSMELHRLASDASLDDVLKRIFIRCLPRSIVTAITSSLHRGLEDVIAAADRAWTAAAASSSPAQATAPVSTITRPQTSMSRRGGRGG